MTTPFAPRAVVFDLDGTLADSHVDIAGAVNDVLLALGRPPRSVEEILGMVGSGATVLLERALGPAGAADLDEARARFAPAYEARLTRTTRLYDGVPAALTALAGAGCALAVATNKPARFTGPLVRALGLPDLGVRAWASADEVPERKPDPAVLRLALERLGVGGGAGVVYVGDMELDVLTARRFGAVAVGVSWGYEPASVAGADVRVDRPEDLASAILGLRPR